MVTADRLDQIVRRMAFAAVLSVLLTRAAAADPSLLDFMGGQGCTFGSESRDAAIEAGFAEADLDALIEGALADGDAGREGDYVVLERQLCTIRPPAITSSYTVTSPEVLAVMSGIDDFAAEGQPGCFLIGLPDAFEKLNGGRPGAGFFDYADFVAAGMISGEITFYADSPLMAPRGPQIVTGDCANVPQIEGIRRSHALMIQAFDPIIRSWGASAACGDWDFPRIYEYRLIQLQGGDPLSYDAQEGVNSWMWMQVMFISIAAGWHEGMTGTDKGSMRPPICHYE